jgi:hypothetical protein
MGLCRVRMEEGWRICNSRAGTNLHRMNRATGSARNMAPSPLNLFGQSLLPRIHRHNYLAICIIDPGIFLGPYCRTHHLDDSSRQYTNAIFPYTLPTLGPDTHTHVHPSLITPWTVFISITLFESLPSCFPLGILSCHALHTASYIEYTRFAFTRFAFSMTGFAA